VTTISPGFAGARIRISVVVPASSFRWFDGVIADGDLPGALIIVLQAEHEIPISAGNDVRWRERAIPETDFLEVRTLPTRLLVKDKQRVVLEGQQYRVPLLR